MKLRHGIGLAFAAATLVSTSLAHAQTGVSDDRVSLPDGPGSLEGIGDDVQINPNMGQMNYGINIVTPTGFPDLNPSLSLSYNSGAGGSIVGLGWSMAMPSIERLTLRGVPQYTLDDEFQADGAQLVYVGGSEPRVYRARFEGSFVKYSWYGHGTDGKGGYWKAEMPDGHVAFYGADADGNAAEAARVGDDALGVFRYAMVTMEDVYGHHIDYTWDDSYGAGTTSLPAKIAWGHDKSGSANYEVRFSYEDRTDWLSNASGGFEEVTDARLDEIAVYAHGTAIRRYDLKYDDYETSGGFSRLSQVLLLAVDDTPFVGSSTFKYSRALGAICADDTCDKPYVTEMGTIDAVLNTGDATLVDINGDALPDIIDSSQNGQPHRIFINTLHADGSQAFAAPYDSALGTQTGHDLSSVQVQVLDANGDGFADVMNASTGDILFNTGAGDWSSKVNVWPQDDSGLPSSEASLAALRFMDFDNDHRIDLIGSTGTGNGNTTTIYRNMGDGFAVASGTEDLETGFDGGATELNDFNGDGLLDAVKVGQSQVTYQLNLGWGRWSETRTAGNFSFTAQEAIDAELEDMNGDGLADLVLVGSDQVQIWINRNGRDFDASPQVLTSASVVGGIPTKGTNTVVLMADMNGNGTSDIVWITPGEPVRSLELYPVKPNLISEIDNGLGTQMTVVYGTSVHHMAVDAEAGREWSYKIPFPNIVVDSITEKELLTGVSMTQTFNYHDGYYDGVEKSFRGYENVEQGFSGDDQLEAGEARMTYELGADPYDPYVAGNLATREALSDGRSIQFVQNTFEDCPLTGIPTSGLRFPIRFTCQTAVETQIREGRPEAEWAHLMQTSEYDGYGNVVVMVDHGVVAIGAGGCGTSELTAGENGQPSGADCTGDEHTEETTYVAPDHTGGRWILNAVASTKTWDGPDGDDYAETKNYYDGDDFVGLSLGELTHGFVSRTTARVDASGKTIDSIRQRRDADGNEVEELDPMGVVGGDTHRTTLTYSDDGQRLVATELHLTDADGEPYTLKRAYNYDSTWDQVAVLNDWTVYQDGAAVTALNTTSYSYDAFGRPKSVVYSGGDTGASPTVEHSYELGSPSRIVTKTRSQVGGAQDVVRVTCVDGRGRIYQKKTKNDDDTWQVDGYTVFASGGDNTRRQYQPYVSDNDGCDDAPPAGTLYTKTFYDALSRPTKTEYPDGQGGFVSGHVEYWPLYTVDYEIEDEDATNANYDTPQVTKVDGRARVVAIGRVPSAGAEPEWWHLTFDGQGYPQDVIDPHGNKHTQTYDVLGHVTKVVDPDRGTIDYTYDDLGNMTSRTDARGVTTRFEYDGVGRILSRWVDGDREGTEVSYQWDLADGCPAGCELTANQVVAVRYPTPAGEATEWHGFDMRGRVTHVSREVAGRTLTIENVYDNADRLIQNKLPGGFSVTYTLDDGDHVTAIPGFVDSITTDARTDVSGVTFANGVTVSQDFDHRRRITGWHVKDASNGIVAGLAFTRDIQGRIVEVADEAAPVTGPSQNAAYTYDAYGRLVEADLDLGKDDEDILTYGYDAIDNLTTRESTGASPLDDGTRTLSATKPHAVTQVGETMIDYDAAGNVIARGEQAFEWDGYGRLATVMEGEDTVAQHVYGDGSERVWSRSDDVTTWFLSDSFEINDGVGTFYVKLGDQSVARHDYADTAVLVLSDVAPVTDGGDSVTVAGDDRIDAADAWIAYAADKGFITLASGAPTPSSADELLSASAALSLIDWGERTTWLLRNHVDTVVAVTDEDGAVVERSLRYPFGLPRWSSTNAAEPFGFTDKRTDPASGLVHIGQRQYDPLLARWNAVDPKYETIDSEDEFSEGPWEAFGGYSYIQNNPVEGQDETGMNRLSDYQWQMVRSVLPLFAASIGAGYQPSKRETVNAITAINEVTVDGITTLDQVFSFVHLNLDTIISEGVERAVDSGNQTKETNEINLLRDVAGADESYSAPKSGTQQRSSGFRPLEMMDQPLRAPQSLVSKGTGKSSFVQQLQTGLILEDTVIDDIVSEMNNVKPPPKGNGPRVIPKAPPRDKVVQTRNRSGKPAPPPRNQVKRGAPKPPPRPQGGGGKE
ncbi:MAG: VCBS repeat-containing protein [Myxococcales bacterium]|nr:VCBS repeat-containing protein [Myxococcales bacterium]MCB9735175.1 VCBS repeat-containing protein [Deltaproteobacteria bacterium]